MRKAAIVLLLCSPSLQYKLRARDNDYEDSILSESQIVENQRSYESLVESKKELEQKDLKIMSDYKILLD